MTTTVNAAPSFEQPLPGTDKVIISVGALKFTAMLYAERCARLSVDDDHNVLSFFCLSPNLLL
jgi:hypothetical protein